MAVQGTLIGILIGLNPHRVVLKLGFCAPQDIGHRQSIALSGGGVAHHEQALRVLQPHTVWNGIEQSSKVQFAALQRLARAHVLGHIGKCAHPATIGHGLRPDFQHQPMGIGAGVQRRERQLAVFPHAKPVHQLVPVGIGPEMPHLQLPLDHLIELGLAGQQRIGQTQQRQQLLVVVGDTPLVGQHHHALTQAFERDIHQVGAGMQLLVGTLQLGFGLHALGGVTGIAKPDHTAVSLAVGHGIAGMPVHSAIGQLHPIGLHPRSQGAFRRIQRSAALHIVHRQQPCKHQARIMARFGRIHLKQLDHGRTGKRKGIPTAVVLAQLKQHARHTIRQLCHQRFLILGCLLRFFKRTDVTRRAVIPQVCAPFGHLGQPAERQPLLSAVCTVALHLHALKRFAGRYRCLHRRHATPLSRG